MGVTNEHMYGFHINNPHVRTVLGESITAKVWRTYNKAPVDLVIEWLDASSDCKDLRKCIHGTVHLL